MLTFWLRKPVLSMLSGLLPLQKALPPGIRTNTQNKERYCEHEEQGWQANRFAERANAMKKARASCQRRLKRAMLTFLSALFERERATKWMNNSQKQGRHNHPGHKEYANCVIFHVRRGRGDGRVGSADTRARDEEGGEWEPECTIGGKRYTQKKKKAIISKVVAIKKAGPKVLFQPSMAQFKINKNKDFEARRATLTQRIMHSHVRWTMTPPTRMTKGWWENFPKYSPVAPNVLPVTNSHMPARSWARPP
jgi:hypothetical protein